MSITLHKQKEILQDLQTFYIYNNTVINIYTNYNINLCFFYMKKDPGHEMSK